MVLLDVTKKKKKFVDLLAISPDCLSIVTLPLKRNSFLSQKALDF